MIWQEELDEENKLALAQEEDVVRSAALEDAKEKYAQY